LLLLSGGMDSTTVLRWLRARGRSPLCLVFDYGQSLRREIRLALANAARERCEAVALRCDLPALAPGHALLDGWSGGGGAAVPSGRGLAAIAAGGTPATYVPFRNGVFLAYAVALGESRGLAEVYAGANGLASGNYWDDTEAFARAFTAAARAGTAPGYEPEVRFPLAAMTKAEVASLGVTLGVDFARTWSCYRDGSRHCGECDSCAQRRDGLAAAGLGLDGRPAGRRGG
jgi:7-cyano-7-deazaguanine synthase